MKIYLVPTNEGYELCASEHKHTLRSLLEKRVEKMHEGKFKSVLEKYLKKMESKEESALKAVNGFEEIEVHYSDSISEKEAKRKCEEMSNKYFKKNLLPMMFYGTLCPITFVIAPFIPVLNWGVTIYFGYKFSSKYNGLKGYKKVLSSKFVNVKDLESVVKTS